MPTTLRNTDILFNDGTTQSTAGGPPSSISAIGSVVILANCTTTNLLPGNTVAGSDLRYQSTITKWPTSPLASDAQYFSEGTGPNPSTYFSYEWWSSLRGGNGNPGFSLNGTTVMSGTWRVLTPAGARFYNYSGSYNEFYNIARLFLAVRIA